MGRRFGQHATYRARRTGDANAHERKMNVISSAVIAEIDYVIALGETRWICHGNRLPGVAAVHRSIVITSITRAWRPPHRERCGHNVVRILWVDGDRNFRWIDGVGFANANDLLRERERSGNAGEDNERDQKID